MLKRGNFSKEINKNVQLKKPKDLGIKYLHSLYSTCEQQEENSFDFEPYELVDVFVELLL